MIIIGEKINSSIASVKAAMDIWDEDAIKDLAIEQTKAGANYIDVNAGVFADTEIDKLCKLVTLVSSVTELPLCIDSPDPDAIEAALKVYNGKKPLINSITLEQDRFNKMIKLAKEYNTSLVALCMADDSMPESAEERIAVACELIEKITAEGIAQEDIFLDPMQSPLGVEEEAAVSTFKVIKTIREKYPNVHITCGLSNVSYGLPARKYLNHAFLVMAMAAGLDSAILNPLDKDIMRLSKAADALLMNDEYCEEYIDLYREGYFN